MTRVAQITHSIWVETDGDKFYFTSGRVQAVLRATDEVSAVCEAHSMLRNS